MSLDGPNTVSKKTQSDSPATSQAAMQGRECAIQLGFRSQDLEPIASNPAINQPRRLVELDLVNLRRPRRNAPSAPQKGERDWTADFQGFAGFDCH
jgi:hypothetical protein